MGFNRLLDRAEALRRTAAAPVEPAEFAPFAVTRARALVRLAQSDAELLGDKLRWEPSRGGQLFPHLYGRLAMDAVVWVRELPLGPAGRHRFPEDMA